MSWQSDIVDSIRTNSELLALLEGRVFADAADGTVSTPYLVYQVISSNGETTHDGRRDVELPLIQFTVWATGKAQAIQIASALTEQIEGRNLPGDSNTSLGFSNQLSNRDPATKLFGEVVEFRVSCNRN